MSNGPYYHIFVNRTENLIGKPNWKYEVNLSKEQIIDKFLIPYLTNNNVICSGNIFKHSEITMIKVFETFAALESNKHSDIEVDRVINQQGEEVTRDFIDLAENRITEKKQSISNPTNEAVKWFEKLALRFRTAHSLLEQRKRKKTPFKIEDEYDFQDLLHCFLTIEFNDVRAEQWTPEYAGGSAKIDFLLPEASVSVETKIVTDSHKQKDIGDEIIIDITKYSSHPNCDVLVCLVYDPNFLVKNKFGFIDDLEKNQLLNVRVFVIQ